MQRLICSVLILCLGLGPLIAQDVPQTTLPRIDGNPDFSDFKDMAPSTALSRSMQKISGFTQREPYDGRKATYDTHVYMGYDDKAVYFLFMCFDDEPEKIRARMSPREQFGFDDYVDVQIDTFNDQQRGYTFLTTPLGIQWDALWTEGQSFDDSYNGVWQSSAEFTEKGYMARIAIPFKTLRIPADNVQTWRILFNRSIARLSEESYWPQYTIAKEGRLNQAAIVTGIEGIKSGRNIQVVPYIFARNYRSLDEDTASFVKDDFDPEAGADVKMVFNNGFILDATANPDFSQVESDNPQVTVNQRFEVRFPERRPFFLENADIFRTPINLMFTRRIVDPSGGLRFSGKKGPWSLGVLAIDDEAPGQRLEEDDPNYGDRAEIGVFRLKRDILEQSNVGLIYTNRSFAGLDNTVMGVDSRLKFSPTWVGEFHAVHAEQETEDETLEGNSYEVRVNKNSTNWNVHNHFLRTDEDFRTQLGFIRGEQRPDSMNVHNSTTYTWRGEGLLNAVSLGSRIGRMWNLDEDTIESFVNPALEFEWANKTEFEVRYDYSEQLLEPEEFIGLSENIELTEASFAAELEYEVDARFNFEISARTGTAINYAAADGVPVEADRFSYAFFANYKPINPLSIDARYLFLNLEDKDSGDTIFDNTIARVRANWQFTRELSLRLIGQFEETEPNPDYSILNHRRNLNTDVLVRYVMNPWTALYVGFNSNKRNFDIVETEYGSEVQLTPSNLREDGRQYFLKFSYLFQF